LLAADPAATGSVGPRRAPFGDPAPERAQAIEREQEQHDPELDIQAERLNRFKPASFHDLLRAFARWPFAIAADATPNVLRCSIYVVKYL